MSSASKSRSQRSLVRRWVLAAVAAAGAVPAWAVTNVTLCAAPYTQNLPGPNATTIAVPMWGYSLGACGATSPSSPGPVLVVPPGETTLTVTLVNNLAVPTSLVIAGQKLPDGGQPVMAPDVVGATTCVPSAAAAASDPNSIQQCRIRSFTTETAPGSSGTYTFSNLKPGTYLYQSGTHQQVQVQMGLFGMTTLDGQASGVAQRQLTANANTIIDADVPVVLSEIDPDQHVRIQSTLGSADLATQQTWQAGRNSTFDYNPRFFLVNGKPYDGTGATDLPAATFNGGYVALRLANAGLKSRSLVLTKGHWQLLTEDGNDYAAPREQYSVLLPAGKTSDARMMVTVPASGSSRIAFFDRRGGTDNGTADPLGGQVAQLVLSSGGSAPPNVVDLAITKSNGVSSLLQGAATTYSIVATNNGPNAVTGAIVTDTLPATLTGAVWSCAASLGSGCGAATGTGNIATTVNLAVNGTATFTVNATVAATATGTLTNTASIAAPAGFTDRIPLNNAATDTDTIIPRVADLSITKTNGVSTVLGGSVVTYTVVVSNPSAVGTGPGQSTVAVNGATVTDAVPAGLSGVTWTCVASAGSSCAASGSGGIAASPVNLAQGGTATFTVRGTAGAAPGTIANTATVALPAGTADPDPANNTATDTDIIVPNIGVLDAFTRPNAFNLGGNWSQPAILGVAAIGIATNQATSVTGGTAYWNAPAAGYANRQGAAMTLANGPSANGASLILKVSGAVNATGLAANYIRVRSTGAAVVVESTTNRGGTYSQRASFAATLVAGDRVSAVANTDGTVDVWKTSGTSMTYLGRSTAAGVPFNTGTASRIGLQLPALGTVDDFGGGTVTP